MFVQRVSQNIFGLKTVVPDTTSNSLTSITDIATRIARDLTSLSKFATLTDFLPDNVKNLVNLAHSKFLTLLIIVNLIVLEQLLSATLLLMVLMNILLQLLMMILLSFLDCIIRGTNAAFNERFRSRIY